MGTGRLVVHVKEEGSRRPVAGATIGLGNESGYLPSGTTGPGGSIEATELPEGWVWARATAPGFAPSEPQWATIADGLVSTLRFELQRGVAVEGVVVARDGGAPVAGARIEAIRGRQVCRSARPFDVVESDARGRFRIEVVPRSADISSATLLAVSHESFASADVVVSPAKDDPGPFNVRAEMAPGATLLGIVRDPGGRPVGGARVAAHRGDRPKALLRFGDGISWSGGGSWEVTVRRPRVVETRADGTFALAGLEAGEDHTLVVVAEGHVPAEPVVVRAEASAAPVELLLRKPGGLTVRVVDAAGRAVEDATLSSGGRTGPIRFESVAPGTWRARAVDDASFYVSVTAPGRVAAFRMVEITPGRRRSIRMTMRPSHHLAGTVVDDTGAVVAGARVWAEHSSTVSDDCGLRDAGETDAAGRFRIEQLPAKRHRVMVRAPGLEPTVVRGIRPPSDDVAIVAPRAATVRVRFDVPAGSSLPDEVEVVHAPPPSRGGEPEPFSDAWRRATFPIDRGAAEILGVPARRAVLLIQVPGFQRVERTVKAARGETVELGTIALEPALELAGRVLDADDRPLPGVHVSVQQPLAHERNDRGIRTTTADDGTFRLGGLWRGRVNLAVGVVRHFLTTFEVDVGSDERVTLTIPRDVEEDPIAGVLRRLGRA